MNNTIPNNDQALVEAIVMTFIWFKNSAKNMPRTNKNDPCTNVI